MSTASPRPSHAHAAQAQLQAMGRSLRFEPALEAGFVAHRAERTVQLVRLGSVVAVLLYAVALGFDWLFNARLGSGWTYLLLFAVLSPTSLLPAVSTYNPAWHRFASLFASIAALCGSLGIISLVALLTRKGIAFPHDVLSLSLMYWFFLCGLRFPAAFIFAVATVVTYGVVINRIGMPFPAQLDHLYVLGGVTLLGAIACYLLEYTERRSWLRALVVEELSVRDDLTGLYNRRYFNEHAGRVLEALRAGGRSAALLIMDVDYFKQFNDSAGHLAGDECLRRVARCLREAVGGPLDVIARLGGDEFVILVHGDRADTLMQYGERVRGAVEQLALPHPGLPSRHVTLSVGGALLPAGAALDLDGVIAIADEALYRGKAAGRNCVQWAAA